MSTTKLVALDVGHGLNTSGKETPTKIKEWTLNDAVRDKTVEMLRDYNVDFIFPDNNEGVKDEPLYTRRAMYVNADVDAAVSIHHNANTSKWNSATGVEVFTDRSYTAADERLAKCIYPRLVEYTGLRGRGIKRANFTVIDQNKVPAVLVEGGFMDSTIDYPVITSDEGQTAYARAVAEGLIEFLNLEKDAVESAPAEDKPETPFRVKIAITNLNIRKGPGTNYPTIGRYTGKGVFTIVEVQPGKGSDNGWGRLKSGAGWISLDYATRL